MTVLFLCIIAQLKYNKKDLNELFPAESLAPVSKDEFKDTITSLGSVFLDSEDWELIWTFLLPYDNKVGDGKQKMDIKPFLELADKPSTQSALRHKIS